MSSFNLDDVTKALQSASVDTEKENGISFEGKNLKLNTAEDAKPIVDAILACKDLNYLNLAGNTLGVEAAEALAKALEKHPEFKRALWKDLFTGRLKEEIPKALEHLGSGLVTANSRLTELDLSDNAFGPIGVSGLASLLRSRACFALHALRLNNNGLGISGGKLLAAALTDCHRFSREQSLPLALKIFIAGRNRLENEGAKALAKVFEKIGTLEEISMPQNGIYHIGISALAEAFAKNPNLQIINLNDNTIGPKGSLALGKALPSLQNLRSLNLGDCLLKNRGAKIIAESLAQGHGNLEELNFECNEICPSGGVTLAKALTNKPNITKILLDGNQFGNVARDEIRSILEDGGIGSALADFEDDESEDEEDQDENEDDENEDLEEEEEEEESESEQNNSKILIDVEDFLQSPTPENFLGLGEEKTKILLLAAKKNTDDSFLETFIPVLMKVSALVSSSREEVSKNALETSDTLFQELFSWAQRTEQHSLLNNTLIVNLGLIKSEDKKYKPLWNIDGCLLAVENALKQKYFPTATKDTLKVFMGRSTNISPTVKTKLISALNN